MNEADFSLAVARLKTAGARVTVARQRVLARLLASHRPLSHGELEQALAAELAGGLDRVTLYRVLDDFVSRGLALKASDGRGVFCYSATPAEDVPAAHQTHAHFRCTRCGRVICLDTPAPPAPVLPAGFRLERVEMDVQGLCDRCAAPLG